MSRKKFNNPAKSFCVVVACGNGSSTSNGLKTIYQHHLRHIFSHQLCTPSSPHRFSPTRPLVQNFISQCKKWPVKGEKMILLKDCNKSLITGSFEEIQSRWSWSSKNFPTEPGVIILLSQASIDWYILMVALNLTILR